MRDHLLGIDVSAFFYHTASNMASEDKRRLCGLSVNTGQMARCGDRAGCAKTAISY
jgi:hypothetical protein